VTHTPSAGGYRGTCPVSFSAQDFAEDTEYERLVLERLGTHRVRPAAPDMIYHLESNPQGGASIHMTLGPAETGARRAEELRQALQPLGFVAAYKILDMLVEHVLRANGAPSGRLTFAAKNALLSGATRNLPTPLDVHSDLWDRASTLHSAFVEARHAVTHRRAQVTSNGDLAVYDDQRRLIDTIRSGEVAAFAAAIHALGELVLDASDDARRTNIAAWYLNELQPRHGATPLQATDPMAGRGLLRADLTPISQGVRFDVARARQAIERQQRGYWDLELLLAGGRMFVGRWEDVPDQTASAFDFDPADPPDWLNEQVAAA
jgi:hypothetical protein